LKGLINTHIHPAGKVKIQLVLGNGRLMGKRISTSETERIGGGEVKKEGVRKV